MIVTWNVRRLLGVAAVLATALTAPTRIAAAEKADTASDVEVKAALLYRFAKFVQWPALQNGAPILVCIVGSRAIADAVTVTVRGQNIDGHLIGLSPADDSATWPGCNLLFVADSEIGRASAGLANIRALPVLTVSDSSGFASTSGIIELYVEGGRMRFAINAEAAEHSGLHLSSRLLGLARIVRSQHDQ